MVSRISTAAVAAILLAGCSQQPVQPQPAQFVPSSSGTPASAPPSGVQLAANTSPTAAAPVVVATERSSPFDDRSADRAAPPVTGEAVRELTIPAGTRLRIRLNETLDTKYCRPGERFAAQLEQPLVIGRRVVVPAGASVRGHVTSSKPSGRFKGRAVLGLTLDSIQVGNSSYAIATNLTARVSSSHKKRNLAIIGGSSGGGAAIGAIAGGGVGALIGAGAGAGAGTVGAFFTGRKNVVLPVETELIFSLRSPVMVRG